MNGEIKFTFEVINFFKVGFVTAAVFVDQFIGVALFIVDIEVSSVVVVIVFQQRVDVVVIKIVVVTVVIRFLLFA